MKAHNEGLNRYSLIACALTIAAAPAFAGINRWTSSGPNVAGVTCLAIDPLNQDVVYAGPASRGVFKSSNGGLSWNDPSSGKLDGVAVHSLAIDPAMPSNVYAGSARGVLKSTDGGVSWRDTLLAGSIYNLIFDPQKPSTIYAADFDDVSYYPGLSAVYKSTDDGKTWSRSGSGFSIVPGTLVIDPTQPFTLYAGTYYGGVRKSVDSGSTWRSPGFYLSHVRVKALAIDPGNPNTLYAGTYAGVYKSVDGASTWSLTSSDVAKVNFRALAIDPRNPNTLYAGTFGRGVLRSTDGGASWREFNAGLTNLAIVSLVIDQSGTRLHAGSFRGGVFDYQILFGPLDISVNSEKANLLFAQSDGSVAFRSIDTSGNSAGRGSYGPFDGWNPRAVADSSDGLTRVLWNNLDGSAALWLLGPEGNRASFRYGPATGWSAVDVAVGSDNTTHLLWTNTDGRIALWGLDLSGTLVSSAIFGPYSGWLATAISDGLDGLTRVLWKRADGSAALTLIGRGGIVASYCFGPVLGWTARDVAVGIDHQTRILWTNADGRMALWSVNNSGMVTTYGPIYGPPSGQTAMRLSAGADGLTRVLWTSSEGTGTLWLMGPDNSYQNSFPLETN